MTIDRRIEGDAMIVRIEGDVRLDDARAASFDAVLTCRDRGIGRLLLDLLDARVAPSPMLVQRIDIVQEWAEAAPDDFALALAAPEHLLRPDRAGLYVASRLGLKAHVFTDAVSARAWLGRSVEAPARAGGAP